MSIQALVLQPTGNPTVLQSSTTSISNAANMIDGNETTYGQAYRLSQSVNVPSNSRSDRYVGVRVGFNYSSFPSNVTGIRIRLVHNETITVTSTTTNTYSLKLLSTDTSYAKTLELSGWSNSKSTLITEDAKFIDSFLSSGRLDIRANANFRNATSSSKSVTISNFYFTIYNIEVTLFYERSAPTIKTKVNNTWVDGAPKVKVNGSWKDATGIYTKVNGVWVPSV